MKMKKTIAFMLCATMIGTLGITGCGKTKEISEEANGNNSDAVTLKWITLGPGETGWEGLTKDFC